MQAHADRADARRGLRRRRRHPAGGALPARPIRWAFFFQKRALEVRTAQILDLILPEFSKLMAALAPGGDAEGGARPPSESVQAQAATSRSRTGRASSTSDRRARAHLHGARLLQRHAARDGGGGAPTTPSASFADADRWCAATSCCHPTCRRWWRRATSSRSASASPTTWRARARTRPIDVTLKTSPASCRSSGPATQAVKISEMREGVAVFRVKAQDGAAAQLGSASLAFTASLGGKTARLTTDTSVRPATPHYTQVTCRQLQRQRPTCPSRARCTPEYRQLEAAVSTVAAGGWRMASPPTSPTSSTAAPSNSSARPCRRSCSASDRNSRPLNAGARKGEDARAKRFAHCAARQNADGGFGLWAATLKADEFASVYAIHFLLEARDRGDAVPRGHAGVGAAITCASWRLPPPADLRGGAPARVCRLPAHAPGHGHHDDADRPAQKRSKRNIRSSGRTTLSPRISLRATRCSSRSAWRPT